MLVFRYAVTKIYRFENCHMLLSINEGKRDFLKAKSKKSGKEVGKMNFIETMLNIVANFASESTSLIGYYEPQVPEKLVKPEKEEK